MSLKDFKISAIDFSKGLSLGEFFKSDDSQSKVHGVCGSGWNCTGGGGRCGSSWNCSGS